ncbi:methionine import ATP-binding, putative [Babesia ovis]|uniref:Methionine import ATP-binding, putative n=1 Tax=Babesia ovis TaxID=5869 RepID=A0A9W5TDV1_BABOV|nr:methionine import ATP-binding, putative [Babesia ovis]
MIAFLWAIYVLIGLTYSEHLGDVDIGIVWGNDSKSSLHNNKNGGIPQLFRGPINVTLSLYADANCEIYPLYYQDAEDITFVCNSKKIKKGAPLTLTFRSKILTQWRSSVKFYSSVYHISEPVKSLVSSLELISGKTGNVVICLHRSEAGVEQTVSCKRLTFRMLVAYFSIGHDIYYSFKNMWKHLRETRAADDSNNSIHNNLPKQAISYTPFENLTRFAKEDQHCLLSPLSARICTIEVVGDAKMKVPFNPDNAVILLEIAGVTCDTSENRSNLMLNVANSMVNDRFKRQITLFVNGVKYGSLPQKVDIGCIIKRIRTNPETYKSIVLTTQNDDSGYRSFNIIRFVNGDQVNKDILSISSSADDVGFIKVEEVDSLGLKKEIYYKKGQNEIIISRSMIVETHIIVDATYSAPISLSVIDRSVSVIVNGIKLKCEDYKVVLLGSGLDIGLKHRNFQKHVIVSNLRHYKRRSFKEYAWVFYLGSNMVFDSLPLFAESFATYILVSSFMGMPSFSQLGNMVIPPLALFFKDVETTRRFAVLLLLDIVIIILILMMGLFLVLPKSRFRQMRRSLGRSIGIVNICCNYASVILIVLHMCVFSGEGGSVYLLGGKYPHRNFKVVSLIVVSMWSLITSRISLKIIRCIIENRDHVYVSSFVHKLREMVPGTDDHHCFLEDGKIYKIYFTKPFKTSPICKVDDGGVEIEVNKVVSLPLNGYCGNTNVTFQLFRTDFRGFEGTALTSDTKLKNLELIYLMQNKISVWCSMNNPRTSLYMCDASVLGLYMSTALFDLVCVLLLMLISRWWHPGFSLALFHLIIKLTVIIFASITHYSRVNIENSRFGHDKRLSLSKMCRSDVFFLGLFGKCSRTFALIVYTTLQQIYGKSAKSLVRTFIEFTFLSCAFHGRFPEFHFRKTLDFVRVISGNASLLILYLIAIYKVLRFRWLRDMLTFIRWCIPHRWQQRKQTVDWQIASIRHPICMKVIVTNFQLLDNFRSAFRFQEQRKLLKTLYIHPSINLRFMDISPCYYTTYENGVLPSDTTLEPPTKNRSLQCFGNHKRYLISQEIDKTNVIVPREYITQAESNVNVSFDEGLKVHGVTLSDASDDFIIDIDDCLVEEVVDEPKESVVLCDRLLGVIEWRQPMGWEGKGISKMDSHNTYDNSTRKMQFFVGVGSLTMVPNAVPPKVFTSATYDDHRNILTITAPFIIPRQKHRVHGITCNTIVNSTTIIRQVACFESGKVVFHCVEKLDWDTEIFVIERESRIGCHIDRKEVSASQKEQSYQVNIHNPVFVANLEYIITYRAALHKPNLSFVYIGCAHLNFKEIQIPITLGEMGPYNFVIYTSGESPHKICSVNVGYKLEDKHHFGMKSVVTDVLQKIELNYPGIGQAEFTANTFYFSGERHGTDISNANTRGNCSIKVKSCQYILSDNMSFLVPITTICRLQAFDGEDRFRIYPHYSILAHDITSRIEELQLASLFAETQFIVPNTDNSTITTAGGKGQMEANRTGGLNIKCNNFSTNLDDVHTADAETTFDQVMNSLFSEETYQQLEKQVKFFRKGDNLFIKIQLILMFCIEQLKEAKDILLRQDELTNDVAVRLEMQKFDKLVGQGMMVEDAVASLSNIERFNQFIKFPFILKSEDIYARVNVGREVRRIVSQIRKLSCASDSTIIDHEPFIKKAITEQLLSKIDLRDVCDGVCHIIIPNTFQSTFYINKEYAFLKTSSNEVCSGARAIWVPCFISFINGRLYITLSNRVMNEEYLGRNFEFVITSVECSISNDLIEVIGGAHVRDEQVQIVVHVIEEMHKSDAHMSRYNLIDCGALTLRCHRYLLNTFKGMEKVYPVIKELNDTKLLYDNIDLISTDRR